MPTETQLYRHGLLSEAVTLATLKYISELLTSTQCSHYVGNPLLRNQLERFRLARGAAVMALDAFCLTDDLTQP